MKTALIISLLLCSWAKAQLAIDTSPAGYVDLLSFQITNAGAEEVTIPSLTIQMSGSGSVSDMILVDDAVLQVTRAVPNRPGPGYWSISISPAIIVNPGSPHEIHLLGKVSGSVQAAIWGVSQTFPYQIFTSPLPVRGPTIQTTLPVNNSVTNYSTLGVVSPTQTWTIGFAVSAAAGQTVLIRADGPALAAFGVQGASPAPTLTVYSNGSAIAAPDNWQAMPFAIATAAESVGAFPFISGSADAAVLLTLPPGLYTVSVSGSPGVVLTEFYLLP